MPDIVRAEVRSRMMSGIRGKNTKPELLLRSALHRRGFRFRVHDKRLPGKPDIVFPGRHAVVLVHGCFWHGHQGCKYFRIPDTRSEFWISKIQGNRDRDIRVESTLAELGWRVAVIWECATRDDPEKSCARVADWLVSDSHYLELPPANTHSVVL